MAITQLDKAVISAEQGVLFFLLSLPAVYALTNRLLPNVVTATASGPTTVGLVVHAAVFALVTLVGMYLPREAVWLAMAVVGALALGAGHAPRNLIVWVALSIAVALGVAYAKGWLRV